MNQKMINKWINVAKQIKDSGLTIKDWAKENGYVYNNLRKSLSRARNSVNDEESLSILNFENNHSEIIDTDDVSEISYDRNESGQIISYSYTIYRKGKNPLIGKLSREDMTIVYRLYSYYGASLTQRQVSRNFPELSLVDFKRILRAFEIYKASSPFPPHYFEEHSEDELREMQLREKENDFLRKAEEDRIRNNEKLLKQYASENIELKKQLNTLNNINVQVNFPKIYIPEDKSNNVGYNDIILYLSDMHIGAKVDSSTLYEENLNYGVNEINRRLDCIIDKLFELGKFNTIYLCLMGDMMDSCGVTNKTSRLDHYLPENMDGFEQLNNYLSIMHRFINNIFTNRLCNNMRIYSVNCGNHTGIFEYAANKALFAELNTYPNINCILFDEYFGVFNARNHTYCLCHGKDFAYMKKPMPLNLDEKTKIMIYEWLDSKKIYGDNIHIVKGDLHSNNYNSCKKFDYRNVLSLFGASDYSSFNYSRNSYGLSYDLLVGDNIIHGTFENM